MMGMVELGYISVTHLPIPGPNADDGHGGVGLHISDTLTYSRTRYR